MMHLRASKGDPCRMKPFRKRPLPPQADKIKPDAEPTKRKVFNGPSRWLDGVLSLTINLNVRQIASTRKIPPNILTSSQMSEI
jgi:hypothetical protein